jgi:PAS domain S-box-containing protein
MAQPEQMSTAQLLNNRRQAVAEAWGRALAATSDNLAAAAEIRHRLAELAGQIITLISADTFDPEGAEAAGSSLASLSGIPHDTLGRTLEILPHVLLEGLDAETVGAQEPRLAALMSRLAAGFAQRMWEILQRRQAMEFSTLLAEVQRRTAEVEAANEAQMAEIAERAKVEEALRQSHRTSRVLLDASADLVVLVRADGTVLDANKAVMERFDQQHGAIGAYAWSLLPPDLAASRKARFDEAVRSGRPVRFEVERLGTWFDNIFFPVFDDNGVVASVALVARDITARKQAEETLRRSLEETARGHRLLAALSQAAQAVQQARTTDDVYQTVGRKLTDLGYHVLFLELTEDRQHLAMRYVSVDPRLVRAAERMARQSTVDYRFPVAKGGFFGDLLTAPRVAFVDDTARAVEVVAEAMPGPQQWRARRLASLLRLERLVVAPLTIEGQTGGLLLVAGPDLQQSDVEAVSVFAGQTAISLDNARLFQAAQMWAATLEERVAERTADLLAAEERYRTVFDSANDALFVVDMQGRYIDVNPAACRMLGYSREELLKLGVIEVAAGYHDLPPVQQAALLRYNQQEWRTPRSGFEAGMIDKAGRRIEVEISYSPVIYRGQEAVLSALRDITERRRMQDALRQSEHRLRSQYQRLPLPTYTWQKKQRDLVLVDFNEAADMLSPGRLESLRDIRAAEQFRDYPGLREAMERSLRERTTAVWEGVYRYGVGGRQSDLIATCVFVPPDQVLVHTEDVTGRKQAMEEVHRSQEETARQRNLLLALSGAAQSVARARSPEEVYGAIGSAITALGLQAVVLDISEDRAWVSVHYLTQAPGLPKVVERLFGQAPTKIRAPLAPDGFFEALIARGEVLYCERTAQVAANGFPNIGLAALDKILTKVRMQRSVFAPLQVDGETRQMLGVLGSDLREADKPAIAAFASQAAIALENARLLEELRVSSENRRLLAQRIVAAQEDERLRMSRALHDEAGQNLTALRISLQLLREDMPEEAEDLHQRTDDAAALAAQTLDRLRHLAQDLRPPALDTVGLNQALEGCCVDFAKRTKLQITYRGAELPALPRPAGITLYRLLQEALTNVARHARARQVDVVLQLEHDHVQLAVEDDGQGFDTAALLARQGQNGGLGLLGVRERLDSLGGRLEISAQPGRGTRLVGRIPVADRQARSGGDDD